MKKVSLFLLLAFSFSFTAYAESSLEITEIMYDFPGTDDGHEYVKIKNTGSEPIDITGYKFIDGASTTKHGINIPPKNGGIGSPIIGPGDYLILADSAVTYLSDNPGFSGSVLDSTFSLNNEGGTVELLNKDSNVVASFTYPVEIVPEPEPPAEEIPPAEEVPPTEGSVPNEEEVQGEQTETAQELPIEAGPIDLIINEIMYDLSGTDDGREWIEVYNTGSGDVDLANLKFFEDGTNHNITSSDISLIPAGDFAIIASDPDKFLVDWPEFQGLIFDSTFSLSNIGEDIALKDADGNIIDEISFSSDLGAAGNERSLQRNDDNFIEALPTPGLSNKSVAEPPEEESSASNSQTSRGGPSSKTTTPKAETPKPQKIILKIIAPAYAITNSDFALSASGQPGKYVWNFGNGEVLERNSADRFSYNYQFPGSYMVTLSYFADEKSKPVKTTAKIKVDENPINISEILPDGSVEIHNKATHIIDISGWTLQAGGTHFVLPPETAIVASGHIVLSAKITKFTPADKNAELFYPSGISAFSFSEKPQKVEKVKISKDEEDKPEVIKEIKPTESVADEVVKGVNLAASAAESLPEEGAGPIFPWMLGLGGIIGLSSILSFLIFSGKSATTAGFKIVD